MATFQRFPSALGGLQGFVESLPPEACETTWTAPKQLDSPATPGSTVYIYVRDDTPPRKCDLLVRGHDAAGRTQWKFA